MKKKKVMAIKFSQLNFQFNFLKFQTRKTDTFYASKDYKEMSSVSLNASVNFTRLTMAINSLRLYEEKIQ